MRSENGRVRKRLEQKRRKVVAVTVALLLVAAGGASFTVYRRLLDPVRLARLAQQHLERSLNAHATIGASGYSWRDGLHLSHVTVSVGKDGAAGLQCTCPRVNVRPALRSLLRGRVRVESVTAVKPVCVWMVDAHGASAHPFRAFRNGFPAADADWQKRLPVVDLRDAQIKLVTDYRGGQRVLERLKLTVRAVPLRANGGAYDIVWQQSGAHDAAGHARLDLTAGQLRHVRGGSPWLSLEGLVSAMPVSAEAQRLALTGSIRALDFEFRGASDGLGGVRASLELRDAAASIPISDEERELAPRERYLRFDRIQGAVRLTPGEGAANADMTAVDLQVRGFLHGAECSASARIHADTDALRSPLAAALEAEVSIRNWHVPRPGRLDGRSPGESRSDLRVPYPAPQTGEARFIRRWPALAKIYRDYDPHGLADLDLTITKPFGEGEPIRLRSVLLTAKDGEATCRFLPYPVERVRGVVEYNSNGIFLRGLHGVRGNATVSVDGWAAAPARYAAKNITVTAAGVPIDDVLWAALPADYRRIDETFAPRGAIDAELSFTQPPGSHDSPTRIARRGRVALRDVSAVFRGFPYPVDRLAGTILIDGDTLELDGMTGRAGPAGVQIEGNLQFDRLLTRAARNECRPAARLGSLNLTVRADNVPIDHVLLDALPEAGRRQLARLHASGQFDAEATVSLDPSSGAVTWTSDVQLNDATIRPQHPAGPLEDIHGRLRLMPDRIRLDDLRGRLGEITVTATGELAVAQRGESAGLIVSKDGPTETTVLKDGLRAVVIRGEGTRLDPQLIGPIIGGHTGWLDGWRIDGPFSFETTVTTTVDAQNPDPASTALFAVPTTGPWRMTLRGAAVRHDSWPVALEQVRGEIDIDRGSIRAEGVLARYADAVVRLDVDVDGTRDSQAGVVSISAGGLPLSAFAALLPEPLASRWAALEPDGVMNLFVDRIRYERTGSGAAPTWSIHGYVELHDASLRGAGGLSRASGTVTVSGMLRDETGGSFLSGELALATASVSGARIENFQSPWSFALTRIPEGAGEPLTPPAARGVLKIPSFHARVYDGPVTGEVVLSLDRRDAEYRLTASVQQIQLRPLVNTASLRDPEGKPLEVHGRLNGHLNLSGVAGDPARRRGGGRFEIVRGHIYRVPLIFAILNVLNLSSPLEDAIDGARVSFQLQGDRVYLSDIHLRGPALQLVGSGSLSLPDGGVDLGLVHVNPHRWARVPGLTTIAETAFREMVELHVSGPVSRPAVHARPFRALTDEFRELFQKRKPRSATAAGG